MPEFYVSSPDLKVPEKCMVGYCPFAYLTARGTGLGCSALMKYVEHCDYLPEYCPVKILEPHGNLVDADVLKAKIWSIRRECQFLDDTQTADKIMYGLHRVELELNSVPTVIDKER